ncbi:MAG: HNH endonuclease [bacterium]
MIDKNGKRYRSLKLLMKILLEAIERKEVITYGQVRERAREESVTIAKRMHPNWHIPHLLGNLNRAINDCGLLKAPITFSAIVVNQETKLPGPKIAGFPGFEGWKNSEEEQPKIAETEQKKVFKYSNWSKVYKELFKEDAPSVVAIPMHKREAKEGEQYLREIKVVQRSPSFAYAVKKKHGFKCQSCGYFCKVGDKYIIDCHHKTPIGTAGESIEVTESDLSVLCPNCHRIAHTDSEKPLSVAQIKNELRKNKLI